ncbi:hypothetical protein LTSEALA_2178 [Salmonella enterica subsp. enterica serovar Alachua str. R6-377]|uniref:Uncharacterized protein n=1 Tax=Salmonella enterica subsp. enterica serovar Alachua str. R6-377 TaxID=913241 RepID=G5LNF8_SALET|nr:hypothetical protein LTSEALA_2178 [Salmonella enterica subsp. enterica serovar Alachua str. R6-377]
MDIKQLVNHRRDKRCFTAAAQPGYGKTQMPVYPTIDQRVEFSFKSLH